MSLKGTMFCHRLYILRMYTGNNPFQGTKLRSVVPLTLFYFNLLTDADFTSQEQFFMSGAVIATYFHINYTVIIHLVYHPKKAGWSRGIKPFGNSRTVSHCHVFQIYPRVSPIVHNS